MTEAAEVQDVAEFQNLKQREHVLKRPGMYVGSMNEDVVNMYVYKNIDNKHVMVKEDVVYLRGLMKIINELIENAIDNTLRDPPTTVIEVEINGNYITVANNGKHIPVVKKDFHGEMKWIPSVVFGECLSGTNFNANRKGIGLNGLGCKLSNIMSSEFIIEIYDPIEKKLFIQSWRKNMSEKEKERIIKRKTPRKKNHITKVTMKPQMSLFNKKVEGRPKIKTLEDMIPIIFTHLIITTACMRNNIKVYFNGNLVNIASNFQKLIKLHTTNKFIYDKVDENFEYGITVSPSGTFEHQSFVNRLHTTSDRSTHTRYVTNTVVNLITSYLEKKYKNNTGAVKLDKNAIKNKIMVFVNIQIDEPEFNTQDKVELTTPIPKSKYPLNTKRIMELIKSTGVLDELENKLQQKALNIVKKELSATTKVRNLVVNKLDDAHNAGTARSMDTMLFLVEGDSAKTFVSAGLSIIKRQNYGVFPLKGKVLNVRNATMKELMSNTEITNIMKILGLNFNKTYEDESSLKQLRYGKLCILTDADKDGSHITGLLISFFDHFWPALIKKHRFLFRFITPVIKAEAKQRSKQDKFFYNIKEFEAFDDTKCYNIHHLKGLGTSERKDTISYFKNMDRNIKKLIYDDDASFYLEHIFGKGDENSKWRKQWMIQPSIVDALDYTDDKMRITDFLNSEAHEYSVYTLRRSIPSVMDGMKSSLRKILYACFKKFSNNGNTRVKVAQLASYVASVTNYAHGEESLNKTIIGMAHDFAGSNNINLLEPVGSFGSRLENGKDSASPRYINTKFIENIRDIYKKEDEDILEYLVEEGQTVEPRFYIPQIPMILVNGSLGLATGFKSKIPCFNPDDIMRKIKAKLTNRQDDTELLPWYRNYKSNDKTTFDKENKRWALEGRYKIKNENTIIIDEIPINVSIEQYKNNVLTKLKDKKDIVKDFLVNHVDENNPMFVVYTNVDTNTLSHEDILKVFRLTHTISMSCFNLLDEHDNVITFKTIDEIMDYWFEIKMKYIVKRKENQLNVMNSKLDMMTHKIKFINSVINGDIDLRNTTEMQIKEYMKNILEIQDDYIVQFLKIPVSKLTKDNVSNLSSKISELQSTIEILSSKTPKEIYLDDIDSNKKRSMSDTESSKKRRINI